MFRPKDKKHLQALSTETRRERGKHRPSSYFAASFVRLLAATTRSRRKARLDREGQPHLRLPRDGILGFGRLDRLGRDITLDMELGVPALRLFHTYTPTTRRVHGAQDNHSWRQSQRPWYTGRNCFPCTHVDTSTQLNDQGTSPLCMQPNTQLTCIGGVTAYMDSPTTPRSRPWRLTRRSTSVRACKMP